MPKNAWLTRDGEPGEQCVCIRLPSNLEWRADFLGALEPLGYAENWEQHGEKTPEEMAIAWQSFLWTLSEECTP